MKIKTALLLGGIFAPLLYLLNDLIGGIITPNYSFLTNSVSDLTKAGSSYQLGSLLLLISAIMGIAFGLGIVQHSRNNKLVSLSGLGLALIGFFNVFTATIFPQDPIGAVLTFPGTMHLVLVAISAILIFPIVLMIAQGLYRDKNWVFFKKYTHLSALIMFLAGAFSAIVIGNNLELLGLAERLSIYTFQLWSVVLATLLFKDLRRKK